MTDIFKDIEAAADEDKKDKVIDLGPISRLVDKQHMLEKSAIELDVNCLYAYIKEHDISMATLEEATKKRAKDLFNVRQVQIPELMKEFGLNAIESSSGVKIKIMDGLSVTVKDKDKLHKFLRDNDAGDLIKNNVTVEVENEEKRKEVVELLEKHDFSVTSKEAVHAATLKKHVKGMLEKGKAIPEESLKTYEYEYSKIKK